MSRLPLEGVRVLDLSRVLAGPYATQMLGDLGADVWKIERPLVGDETRAWGPPFVAGESAYYLSVNRNKRSAALDFNDPVHRAAIVRAARDADVVVENFLPGHLERFGLDPVSLRRDHPGLVVCSITGFGQDGPYAALPGYDALMQGFVGLMSVTGEEGGPPLKVGVAIVDVVTGAHAAAAILAALVGRATGGSGTHLDVCLSEVGVAAQVNWSQSALSTGAPARRYGNAHPYIVPYQTFETADEPMVVAVGNDEQWRRLCQAMGTPSLASDPRFGANADRVRNRVDLIADLSARFASAPRATWLDRLRRADVPCGPVRGIDEVMRDPVLASRGMIADATLAEDGARPAADVRLLTLPWRADGIRPGIRVAPPRLGQHTAEFLARYGS
jgi:crotonobetainyl-CoA:carnitine CoA-transferase CaiB-like acyl-CoA transferase